METGPEKSQKKKRKFTRNGAIWLKRKEPDGAGNSTQYMLIQMMINNQKMLFSAFPNFNKTKPEQPDFIVFSSQPVGEGAAKRERKSKSQ